VQPIDVYLREDLPEDIDGGVVYLPDGAGNFHLPEVVFCVLIVEGTTVNGFTRNADSSRPLVPGTPRSSVVVASVPPPPLFRSVVAPKKQPSKNIKIMQARLSYNEKNRPKFSVINHHFISVTQSTANVKSICEEVHKECGAD